MKRDWNLIREILIAAEINGNLPDDVGWNVMWHHFDIMTQVGLLEPNKPRLTWKGCELLEQIRQEEHWDKIKSTIQEKGLPMTLDVIQAVTLQNESTITERLNLTTEALNEQTLCEELKTFTIQSGKLIRRSGKDGAAVIVPNAGGEADGE